VNNDNDDTTNTLYCHDGAVPNSTEPLGRMNPSVSSMRGFILPLRIPQRQYHVRLLCWVLLCLLMTRLWIEAKDIESSLSVECRMDGTCDSNSPSSPSKLSSQAVSQRARDAPKSQVCSLWMAESSIPGAGWGIFAGTAIPAGQELGSDVVIQYVDARHQAELQKAVHDKPVPKILLSSYFWKSIETHAYFDADQVESIVPGLGMLANGHLGLANVEQAACRDLRSTVPRADPRAGAQSHYNDCVFRSTRPIPAGHEIYVDYGSHWFTRRPHLFGEDVPLADDYTSANDIVQQWQRLIHTTKAGHYSDELASDLWRVMVQGVVRPHASSRLLRALLPLASHDAASVNYTSHRGSVAYFSVPNAIRSTDWLTEHGWCLDQVQAEPRSSLSHGTTGSSNNNPKLHRPSFERTVVARLDMAAGEVVAPAPLIHLSRQHTDLLWVEAATAQGKDPSSSPTVMWRGHQLLLNYCYGHASSSLLLFPYSPLVNLVQPADPLKNQTANVALRWSKRMPHPEWLEFNVSTLLQQYNNQSGLLMEFYALRDIVAGEQILLDFGASWQTAWEEHVRTWERSEATAHRTNHNTTVVEYRSAFEYLQECNENATPHDRHDCWYHTPTWIDTRCWVDLPTQLPLDQQENDTAPAWRVWQPPQDDDEASRMLDDTLACQVLQFDRDNGTYRVRVQRNQWLSVKKGVLVRNVPRSAFTLVDKPYTGDQFLRRAFRHEISLPDAMVPTNWRDLDDPEPDETCGLFMAESSIPNAGLGIYSARNVSKGDQIFYDDLALHVQDFERNAKLRKRAHNESDDDTDTGAGEWLLDNYYWNAKTSMGNFDADDVQSIIPGFGA
jgi:hypothetical protein